MYRGAMLQFGGLAIMPFALLVLSGAGQAAEAPGWIGLLAAAASFLLVGAGVHTTQTVGLALATDLAPVDSQPRVVGLMYVMLLFGMIAGALVFGAMLEEFTPARLIQVVQATAVVTLVLNAVALWKQEPRRAGPVATPPSDFLAAWAQFRQGGQAGRRLLAIGLGTIGFGMGDVLLEPYGGQLLQLSVADTTKLTAALALGGLLGFGWASRALSRGADPFRMAAGGCALGMPAFVAVILAAPLGSPVLFVAATLLIGFGAGLFGHGTLTATMNAAPREQTGLALGAWGAVQASAAGAGIALGGVLRDGLALLLQPGQAATAYGIVYALEFLLLLAALVTMLPLMRRTGPRAWAYPAGPP